MSLTDAFNSDPPNSPDRPSKPKNRRNAPFSLRLSPDERARLASEAAGAPLGAYIKAKIFGRPAMRLHRSGLSIKDRTALAQLFALLGRSDISSNLDELAWAVRSGLLPLAPETEEDLRAALNAVCEMRSLLFVSLGHRVGETP